MLVFGDVHTTHDLDEVDVCASTTRFFQVSGLNPLLAVMADQLPNHIRSNVNATSFRAGVRFPSKTSFSKVAAMAFCDACCLLLHACDGFACWCMDTDAPSCAALGVAVHKA